MKDVTPKQIALLYVLVCLLVIIVAVKYLLLPAKENYDKEQQSYMSVSADYEELEMQSSFASVYETKNKEIRQSINEMKGSFQPALDKEDIDKVITKLIYKNSMETQMLFISDPVDYVLKKADVTDNVNNAGTNAQTTTTTTTTTTTALSETSVSSNGNQQNNQPAENQTQNQNVKVSHVNVTVSGKYVNFVKLLNDIKSTKGMTVSDISFSTDQGVSPMSNMIVSLDINVYMYDDSGSDTIVSGDIAEEAVKEK